MGPPDARCTLGHGELQTGQPYGVGLQVPHCVGYEISVPHPWGRCGAAMPGADSGDGPGARNGHSRRLDQPHHVHMLLSVPPSLSVSRAVQYLKGRSSHKLLAEFASLRKRYWGQHLWTRGYWVASSGNVTDEVWAEYIKNQSAPEPDDDFNVT